MLKLLLISFIVSSLSFEGTVICKKKVETSQTQSSKYYTWLNWSATPPCTSNPPEGADAIYCSFRYDRVTLEITKLDCGTPKPGIHY